MSSDTAITLDAGVSPVNRADMATDNALDRTRSVADKVLAARLTNEALVRFRQYQLPVFMDRESGILILHWSRQIGKSYTLAAWAVDRLLTQLKNNDTWLITVLSNSRDNGAEFVIKCQDICNKLGIVLAKQAQPVGDAMVYDATDNSPDLKYDNMRMEVRITLSVNGRERIGRIKVLAANPRTARGFSGDLILDEFAFHEDSNAIWEAAEPILSSNPEFRPPMLHRPQRFLLRRRRRHLQSVVHFASMSTKSRERHRSLHRHGRETQGQRSRDVQRTKENEPKDDLGH